jgi:hypothetical protein
MEQTNSEAKAVLAGNKKTASEKISIEEAIIYDECGDTLWDAVLAQDEKNASINNLISSTQDYSHPAK